jgi:hypothetical protein
VETVGRQLVGRHVAADVPVQQRRQFGAVVLPAPLVLDHSVRVQHLLEPLAGRAVLVADFGQLGQVGADVAVVPGGQDRLDVREVLVQRGRERREITSSWGDCTLRSTSDTLAVRVEAGPGQDTGVVRRSRGTTVALVVAVALVVVAHVVFGGAAPAAWRWTSVAADILLALVILKIVVVTLFARHRIRGHGRGPGRRRDR